MYIMTDRNETKWCIVEIRGVLNEGSGNRYKLPKGSIKVTEIFSDT